MFLIDSLENQFRNAERIISGHRPFQVAALILLLDAYLVFAFGKSITQVDAAWLKSQCTIGQVLTLVLLMVCYLQVAIPFLLLMVVLPVHSIFTKRECRQLEANLRADVEYPYAFLGIRSDDFLHYSILSDNGVAYSVYKREIQKHEDALLMSKWAFAMLTTVALNLLSSINSGSTGGLVSHLYAEVRTLPWILLVPVAFSVTVILLGTVCLAVIPLIFGDRLRFNRRLFVEVENSKNDKPKGE